MDDVPDEGQAAVVRQNDWARYSLSLEDSEHLRGRHVPQRRWRARPADQDPAAVDRQRHGDVGSRRTEVLQWPRQLLSSSHVHQRLLSAENISGKENATLRRNPVTERVQPISGGKVVDVRSASNGVAVDDK